MLPGSAMPSRRAAIPRALGCAKSVSSGLDWRHNRRRNKRHGLLENELLLYLSLNPAPSGMVFNKFESARIAQ
jgi:hypothetical protein